MLACESHIRNRLVDELCREQCRRLLVLLAKVEFEPDTRRHAVWQEHPKLSHGPLEICDA